MAKGHENIKPPQKGEIRNPKGRGKSLNRKTIAKRFMDIATKMDNPFKNGEQLDLTVAEQMFLSAMSVAMNGDLKAIEFCFNQRFGQMVDKSKVDATVKNITPPEITFYESKE